MDKNGFTLIIAHDINCHWYERFVLYCWNVVRQSHRWPLIWIWYHEKVITTPDTDRKTQLISFDIRTKAKKMRRCVLPKITFLIRILSFGSIYWENSFQSQIFEYFDKKCVLHSQIAAFYLKMLMNIHMSRMSNDTDKLLMQNSHPNAQLMSEKIRSKGKTKLLSIN